MQLTDAGTSLLPEADDAEDGQLSYVGCRGRSRHRAPVIETTALQTRALGERRANGGL